MADLKCELKVETFGRGKSCLTLGILVSIDFEGVIHFNAPLQRVNQRIQAKLKEAHEKQKEPTTSNTQAKERAPNCIDWYNSTIVQ